MNNNACVLLSFVTGVAVSLLVACGGTTAVNSGDEPVSTSTVPHYEIHVEIDPGSGRLQATVDMEMPAPEPGEPLSFLLHEDLAVTSLDSPALEAHAHWAWTAESIGMVLPVLQHTVWLDPELEPGQTVWLRWEYAGHLDDDRLTFGPSHMSEEWMELPVEAMWLPMGDDFETLFTAQARVVLPDAYSLVGPGSVTRVGQEWLVESPTPGLDMPLIASATMTCEAYGDDSETAIRICGVDPDPATAAFLGEHGASILERYSELMGPPHAMAGMTVTVAPVRNHFDHHYARPGLIALRGGIEADESTFALLAHETAHLWWMYSVAPRSRHNFLNESLAEYFSWLEVRRVHGEALFHKQLDDAREQTAASPGFDQWSPANNHLLAYRKGPVLLYELHGELGDDGFHEFARALHAEQSGTLEGMLAVLERVAGSEASDRFNSWLYSEGIPGSAASGE